MKSNQLQKEPHVYKAIDSASAIETVYVNNMNNCDDKIKAGMKLQNEKWVKAGKPAPGTIAYIQLFSAPNLKPHYVFKKDTWWAFRSRYQCKKFFDAIKKGTYDRLCEPRPLIKTECGIM